MTIHDEEFLAACHANEILRVNVAHYLAGTCKLETALLHACVELVAEVERLKRLDDVMQSVKIEKK